MRNKILIILVCVFSFVACEKNTKLNDKEIPTISDIRVNQGDTILIRTNGNTGEVQIVYLNQEDVRPDTVILGKQILFSGYFTDNEALSAYKLELRVVPENTGIGLVEAHAGDSAISLYAKGTNVFNMQDTLVHNYKTKMLTKDSLYQSASGKTIPVRNGRYDLHVFVVDKAGNQDSVQHPLYLLNRKDFIENRSKD